MKSDQILEAIQRSLVIRTKKDVFDFGSCLDLSKHELSITIIETQESFVITCKRKKKGHKWLKR